MSNRPRWWKAGTVYSETRRTVDRQFLLRPCPEVRNLVGACLGRAWRKYPVTLYWCEANINHIQIGRSPLPGHLDNMSKFDQMFYSILSRELNRLWEREGPIWSTKNRSIECVDDQSAEDRLLYSMSNPIKDGLCQKVKHWHKISFSAYGQLAEGTKERYSYINWTKWHRQGGPLNPKRPEDYTEWVDVEFAPLPHLAGLPAHKREERLRRQLRQFEQAERDRRDTEQRPSMTLQRLLKTDPRQRPKTRKPRTPMPRCHASSRGARQSYHECWKAYLHEYIQASAIYRTGFYAAEFPDGSFRPPLTSVCNTTMRC